MSDAVIIALIVASFGALPAVIGVVVSRSNGRKLDTVGDNTNGNLKSMTAKLSALQSEVSRLRVSGAAADATLVEKTRAADEAKG